MDGSSRSLPGRLSITGLVLVLLTILALWVLVIGPNSGATETSAGAVESEAIADTPDAANDDLVSVSEPEAADSPAGVTGRTRSVSTESTVAETVDSSQTDTVAIASVTPSGFEMTSKESVESREGGSSVAHIQRFVRGGIEDYDGLAAIKIRTVDWPYDHSAELARYEGARSINVAGNDAVLYFSVPEEPGEGLTVIRWGLGDSRLIMVTARGDVTLKEILAVAEGVVLEVKS